MKKSILVIVSAIFIMTVISCSNNNQSSSTTENVRVNEVLGKDLNETLDLMSAINSDNKMTEEQYSEILKFVDKHYGDEKLFNSYSENEQAIILETINKIIEMKKLYLEDAN